MGILYISEFAQTLPNSAAVGPPWAMQPPIAQQKITYSTTTASAAFNSATRFVRIHTDSICSINFGPSATVTATTSNARMAAGATEYFGVAWNAGQGVAAITNT